MDFKKDYYKILGLDKEATKEAIRAAYRKLAVLHHPDKNPNNPEAEEIFKEINEAHEVLYNDVLRHEYDSYKKEETLWKERQQSEANTSNASASNKRTYEKTNIYTTEKRVYVRGEAFIKYWGEPEEEPSSTFQTAFHYKINPTETKVVISHSDVHPPQAIPKDFQKSYTEADLFKIPIAQPVKCVLKTDKGDEYYELELKEIRLKNIRLEEVVKHEGRSFGTLIGDLFAYTPKYETFEEKEWVTECFGETGRVETKKEPEGNFYRKEYYHPDCTTFWGAWQEIKTQNKTRGSTGAKSFQKQAPILEANGCVQLWWLPLVLFFTIAFPQAIIPFLVLGVIGLLFYLGAGIFVFFRRLISVVVFLLLFFLIVSAVRNFSSNRISYVKKNLPTYDTLRTTREPLPNPDITDTTSSSQSDTLINHFIRWEDYDNISYEANLAIAVSDVRASIRDHEQTQFYDNSLTPVYSSMLQADENRLRYIYATFDSIKNNNTLDELQFARMIVSCVQSIPYFLVVDRSCNDNYDDEFTQSYLANCNGECCIGYSKFGVRTPAEFTSDLKGDCDTRALFLYGILKRYNYSVALLTSQYYRHALIAVNFKSIKMSPLGLAMNIHDKNYYLWETTNKGFNAGEVPTNIQNLDYWNISLLNENK